MFLLKRGCGALGLDEIVKDILDKKDNAISMEFTKCIGELLRKNGVVPKITEVRTGGTFDKDRNVIEERYGVLIEGLDFSEHDKVFEDTISELGHMIGVLERAIDTLRSRCTESARELFDRNCYGGLTIVCHPKEMEFENNQLKQRIDDLESKLEMYKSEYDPRNHSKEPYYFVIAQNQLFRKENERLKNKNKILYDYIHGITGNTEDEIDKNIKSLESNENHIDIKVSATPMDISTHLINNTCTINELEQIAEHLLVYCKHNKTSE